MGFGFINVLVIFQVLMNDVFYDFFGLGVDVYLDDVLIYLAIREEYLVKFRTVF